jgi:hypothetical protein
MDLHKFPLRGLNVRCDALPQTPSPSHPCGRGGGGRYAGAGNHRNDLDTALVMVSHRGRLAGTGRAEPQPDDDTVAAAVEPAARASPAKAGSMTANPGWLSPHGVLPPRHAVPGGRSPVTGLRTVAPIAYSQTGLSLARGRIGFQPTLRGLFAGRPR